LQTQDRHASQTVSLPLRTIEQLRREAQRSGSSASEIMREALEREFRRRARSKDPTGEADGP
jgi:hypothetical protein